MGRARYGGPRRLTRRARSPSASHLVSAVPLVPGGSLEAAAQTSPGQGTASPSSVPLTGHDRCVCGPLGRILETHPLLPHQQGALEREPGKPPSPSELQAKLCYLLLS